LNTKQRKKVIKELNMSMVKLGTICLSFYEKRGYE
jgi:hypothetical protein